MEASGGYERAIRDRLSQAGLAVHICDPARVRYFCKAMGKRAKTDRIDAAAIAAFTASTADTLTPVAINAGREKLASLVRARRLLVDKRADLGRAAERLEGQAKAALTKAVDEMAGIIESLDQAITTSVLEDAALKQTVEGLQSAPGIGQLTAIALSVLVPELGHLSRTQIAALLGLAPHARDSGQHQGQRHIAGGRAEARKALYMATVSATTRVRSGVLRDFYTQLVARGKPPKVALTACMRKLIVRLNAMLAHKESWKEQAA
jgi:transposase